MFFLLILMDFFKNKTLLKSLREKLTEAKTLYKPVAVHSATIFLAVA